MPLFKKLANTRVPTAIGALFVLARFFFLEDRAFTRTPPPVPPVLTLLLLLLDEEDEDEEGGGLLLRGSFFSLGLGAGGGRGKIGVGSKRTYTCAGDKNC